jgi:hypothetical protein
MSFVTDSQYPAKIDGGAGFTIPASRRETFSTIQSKRASVNQSVLTVPTTGGLLEKNLKTLNNDPYSNNFGIKNNSSNRSVQKSFKFEGDRYSKSRLSVGS